MGLRKKVYRACELLEHERVYLSCFALEKAGVPLRVIDEYGEFYGCRTAFWDLPQGAYSSNLDRRSKFKHLRIMLLLMFLEAREV